MNNANRTLAYPQAGLQRPPSPIYMEAAWEIEGRILTFVDTGDSHRSGTVVKYGGRNRQWGNMLALDLLQLKVNEGENASRDLSVPMAGML